MLHFGAIFLFFITSLNAFAVTKARPVFLACARALTEKNSWSAEARPIFDLFDSGKSGWDIAEKMRSHGIKSEKERFGIAMLIAGSRDAGGVAKFIKNFDIRSADLRYQLALKAAVNDGGAVSRYLNRFNIRGVAKLFEVAKACAVDNGISIGAGIRNFHFKSERMRFEVAKAAAQSEQQGWDVLVHIANYQIKNQDWLKEIALLAVNSSAYSSRWKLPGVGLKRVADRIEVLRAIIERKESVSLILDEFKIDDEKIRLEYAYADAATDPMLFAQNIGVFRLSRESDRFDLAKKVFKWNTANETQFMARRPESYTLL